MPFGNSNILSIAIRVQDEASAVLQKVQTAITEHRNSYQRIANTLTIASAAIATAMGLAIRQSASFEKSLSALKITLGEQAQQYLPQFTKGIKELSKEGVALEDLASALNQVVLGGIPAAKAMGVLTDAVTLAQGKDIALSTAVNLITTALKAYNLTSDKSAVVTDKLAAMGKESAMSFEELSGSLGAIMTTASNAGVGLEEIGAILAVLRQSGMESGKAMMSLKSLLEDLRTPSKEQAEIFKLYTTKEMNLATISTEGLIKILKKLKDSGIPESEMNKIFPSSRSFGGTIGLIENIDNAMESYNRILNSSGQAAKDVNEQNKNLTEGLKRIWSQVKLISSSFGETLLPIFNKVSKALEDLLNWYNNLSEATKKSTTDIILLGGAFVLLGTAVITIGDKLILLSTAIKALGVSATATGIAFGALGVAIALAFAIPKVIELGSKIIEFYKVNNEQIEINIKATKMKAAADADLEQRYKNLSKNIEKMPEALRKETNAVNKLIDAEIMLNNYSTTTEKQRAEAHKRTIDKMIEWQKMFFENKRAGLKQDTKDVKENADANTANVYRETAADIEIIKKLQKEKDEANSSEIDNIEITRKAKVDALFAEMLAKQEEQKERLKGDEAAKKLKEINEQIAVTYTAKIAKVDRDAAKEKQDLTYREMNDLAELQDNNTLAAEKFKSDAQEAYKTKDLLIQQTYEREKNAAFSTIKDDVIKTATLEELGKKRTLAEEKNTKELGRAKRAEILATTSYFVESIRVLLEAEGSASKKKQQLMLYLIGLEKALAIAKMWSAESAKGVLGIAAATAGTAAIIAEFAGIYKSVKGAQNPSDTNINAPAGDNNVPEIPGGEISTGGGGGGGSSVGGVSTVINLGGLNVNFNIDKLDETSPDKLETIIRDISERVRSKTIEGIELAKRLYNTGKLLNGEAV